MKTLTVQGCFHTCLFISIHSLAHLSLDLTKGIKAGNYNCRDSPCLNCRQDSSDFHSSNTCLEVKLSSPFSEKIIFSVIRNYLQLYSLRTIQSEAFFHSNMPCSIFLFENKHTKKNKSILKALSFLIRA